MSGLHVVFKFILEYLPLKIANIVVSWLHTLLCCVSVDLLLHKPLLNKGNSFLLVKNLKKMRNS